MFQTINPFLVADIGSNVLIGGAILISIVGLVLILAVIQYGALWLQAYMSGADVSLLSLVGMSFRQVKPSMIVTAQIMAKQAGLDIDRQLGVSTARLEAHYLAGGDVMQVVRAVIAAHLAGMDLDFDRAAAMDLAGRDVLDAVRISVSPQVIDCPESGKSQHATLSAVAKNGIELRIRARVTVRTNLAQLIGGATAETIIARVGQGIISTIGGAATHMDVMAMPSGISKSVLHRGLDANTAFEIVSIDIAEIQIGENIGARLQTDQAEADTRIARARAEVRRAAAIAYQQEMLAQIAENRSRLVLAEAELPVAIATAFRSGQLRVGHPLQSPRTRGRDRKPEASVSDRNASPRTPSLDWIPPISPLHDVPKEPR